MGAPFRKTAATSSGHVGQTGHGPAPKPAPRHRPARKTARSRAGAVHGTNGTAIPLNQPAACRYPEIKAPISISLGEAGGQQSERIAADSRTGILDAPCSMAISPASMMRAKEILTALPEQPASRDENMPISFRCSCLAKNSDVSL